MKPHFYLEFLNNKHLNKDRARIALSAFIASFETEQEKAQWTREFLENEDRGHKIRHELYHEIIFPVLARGYETSDAWATLQLARTMANLADDSDLHFQVNFANPMELLKESYETEPVESLRAEILQAELRFFSYSAHEWPSGILWGNDGATIEQCQELLDEVHWTRGLDTSDIYQAALDDYENKVREYQQILISRQNKN